MDLSQIQPLLDQAGPWGWVIAAAIAVLMAYRGRTKPSPATNPAPAQPKPFGAAPSAASSQAVAGDTVHNAIADLVKGIRSRHQVLLAELDQAIGKPPTPG